MHRTVKIADRIEQRPRMPARVDDAQHLRLLGKARRDGFVRDGVGHPLHRHALQLFVEPCRIGGQFAFRRQVEADGLIVLVAQRRIDFP
ncbi:hypothetical protein V5F77_22695 [Xanthobacter sp. DSM 24535]|uniref:hypothetical protein n=1 Tax=Roseixanthobacter psychrophilus TaxID=3119917 RepID=UPI00372BF64A